jgi:DNA-binding NtrC family response regulator
MITPRKRVLIADCHGDVLVTLEKVLEEAGFDTATVWTAREALQLLDTQFFDLVLTNEYLPDAECEEFLTALQGRGAQMPCIVMQPSAPEITEFRNLQALGARDVVCKYAYRQIVDVISACLAGEKLTRAVA